MGSLDDHIKVQNLRFYEKKIYIFKSMFIYLEGNNGQKNVPGSEMITK